MLDYETLRFIWWILLGALLIGFAIMDGFDFGVCMLLPSVARNNSERRIAINTIGPVWEGNGVWLVLGAGAIFAAWPMLYALAFSGFYFALLLVLLALILRPVAITYRSKVDDESWRACCDWALFLSGLVPAFVFGVAMGNVLQGVPFHFDEMLRAFYTGSLYSLFNPFALLCGLVSVSMLLMNGASYLAIKTAADIQARAKTWTWISAQITIVLFAIAGYWIAHYVNGYTLLSTMTHDGPSNPLYKQVGVEQGAWLHNYTLYPGLLIVPAAGFIGAVAAIFFNALRFHKTAWTSSAISVASIVGTVGVSMFPFIFPSSDNPNMSLLVWDSSSTAHTLFIMLFATAIFLPLIVIYTSWIFYVLRGKVTHEQIEQDSSSY